MRGDLVAEGAGPRPTAQRSVDVHDLSAEFTSKWQAEARRLYPNRTAALTALEAVQATTRLPFTEGLLFEEKLANQTKVTVEARGSIHVFFAERESRKVEGLPAGHSPAYDRRVPASSAPARWAVGSPSPSPMPASR